MLGQGERNDRRMKTGLQHKAHGPPALCQSIYRSNSSKITQKSQKLNHPKITMNVSHECSYNIALRHTTQQHNRKIQILSMYSNHIP